MLMNLMKKMSAVPETTCRLGYFMIFYRDCTVYFAFINDSYIFTPYTYTEHRHTPTQSLSLSPSLYHFIFSLSPSLFLYNIHLFNDIHTIYMATDLEFISVKISENDVTTLPDRTTRQLALDSA